MFGLFASGWCGRCERVNGNLSTAQQPRCGGGGVVCCRLRALSLILPPRHQLEAPCVVANNQRVVEMACSVPRPVLRLEDIKGLENEGGVTLENAPTASKHQQRGRPMTGLPSSQPTADASPLSYRRGGDVSVRFPACLESPHRQR